MKKHCYLYPTNIFFFCPLTNSFWWYFKTWLLLSNLKAIAKVTNNHCKLNGSALILKDLLVTAMPTGSQPPSSCGLLPSMDFRAQSSSCPPSNTFRQACCLSPRPPCCGVREHDPTPATSHHVVQLNLDYHTNLSGRAGTTAVVPQLAKYLPHGEYSIIFWEWKFSLPL